MTKWRTGESPRKEFQYAALRTGDKGKSLRHSHIVTYSIFVDRMTDSSFSSQRPKNGHSCGVCCEKASKWTRSVWCLCSCLFALISPLQLNLGSSSGVAGCPFRPPAKREARSEVPTQPPHQQPHATTGAADWICFLLWNTNHEMER